MDEEDDNGKSKACVVTFYRPGQARGDIQLQSDLRQLPGSHSLLLFFIVTGVREREEEWEPIFLLKKKSSSSSF